MVKMTMGQRRRDQKRESARRRYPVHCDKKLEYAKKRRVDAPDFIRGRDKQYREKYALQKKARNSVTNAIRLGTLDRENCYCGRVGEAHHEDYSKPLEVTWLCTEHHRFLHRK